MYARICIILALFNILLDIANGNEMTRKFLFCFPLRVGNIVFGYTVIIIAIAVMIYNLYCLTVTLLPEVDEVPDTKFKNWKHLEELFGTDKDSLVLMVTLIYYFSYVVIGFLLMFFGALFTCGAHKASNCPVTTFFVYSFLHLFLTIGLVVWEATSGGYIQLGLIVLTDVLLIICLFGVKNLMEAINRGYVYSHPGEVLYKY